MSFSIYATRLQISAVAAAWLLALGAVPTANASNIVFDTLTGTINGQTIFQGAPFTFAMTALGATYTFQGNVNFGSTAVVSATGPYPVTLVVGNDVTIAPGAQFNFSAVGYQAGPGGGMGGGIGDYNGGTGGLGGGSFPASPPYDGGGGAGGQGGGLCDSCLFKAGQPGQDGNYGAGGTAGQTGGVGLAGQAGFNAPGSGGAGGAGGAHGLPTGLVTPGGFGGTGQPSVNTTNPGGPGMTGGTGRSGLAGSPGFGGASGSNPGPLTFSGGGGGGQGGGGGGGGGGDQGGGGGGGGGLASGIATTFQSGDSGGAGGKGGPGGSGGNGGFGGIGGGGGGAFGIVALGTITSGGSFTSMGGNGTLGETNNVGLPGLPGAAGSPPPTGAAGGQGYGGAGGTGGYGGSGGPSGAGGQGGAGAGGTIELQGSVVNLSGTTVNTQGGLGGSGFGGYGKFLVGSNTNPGSARVMGGTEQQVGGVMQSNPLIAGDPETPEIPDLIGGAAPFGPAGLNAATDLPALAAGAPSGAIAALELVPIGPSNYDEDFTGFDFLIFANLMNQALTDPELGVGSQGMLQQLLSEFSYENPLLGGSGPATLPLLAPEGVYLMLVPTGTTDFNFGATWNGMTLTAFQDNLGPGSVLYLTPPSGSGMPEPSPLVLCGLGLVLAGSLQRRLRKGK